MLRSVFPHREVCDAAVPAPLPAVLACCRVLVVPVSDLGACLVVFPVLLAGFVIAGAVRGADLTEIPPLAAQTTSEWVKTGAAVRQNTLMAIEIATFFIFIYRNSFS